MSPDQRTRTLTIPRGHGSPLRWDTAETGVLQLVGARGPRHRAIRSVLAQATSSGWSPVLVTGARWDGLPTGARQANTTAEIVGLLDTLRHELGTRYAAMEDGLQPAGTTLLIVDDVEGVLAALPTAGATGKIAHQSLAALARMGAPARIPVILAGDRCPVRPHLTDLTGARRVHASAEPYRLRDVQVGECERSCTPVSCRLGRADSGQEMSALEADVWLRTLAAGEGASDGAGRVDWVTGPDAVVLYANSESLGR